MHTPTRSVVIHGHFYQPPREDPWSGRLEAQPSAAPHHDWNVRVEQECYRSVVAARVPGAGGRIREIVNTLQSISFNFGPTLLAWMEEEAPKSYQAILEADLTSQAALGGHGNAIAQAYHHAILPLASRRDKVTEVRWGMEDFRRRFRREPTGMWLPETAVDAETLDVLAQEGVAFTIVAPHQVASIPRGGLPGLFRTSGGRAIALFVYDGPISHDVAFGPLLKNAPKWAGRMAGGEETARLVSMATDGESYGHHHRFGEMALAAVLGILGSRPNIRVENFASFLNHTPPEEEVALVEPSSWSCSHGVERWRSDCGCKMAPKKDTQQEWRSGLREAMEWLAGDIHLLYEDHAPSLFGDPWEARNQYGRVVTGAESLETFLDSRLSPGTGEAERIRAAELMELERNALRLFTSCGWFFDDLAGIEPLQVLRYAARALEIAEGIGAGATLPSTGKKAMEENFLSLLREAESNEVPPRDGATLFLEEARPSIPSPPRSATPTRAPEGEETEDGILGRALVSAINALEDAGMEEGEELKALDETRTLARLHAVRGLPIPFDAQTTFYRIMEQASGRRLAALSSLREPLGFVRN
jgi:alpha-amylase/alpha-mannosidase (GH57 family)